MSQLKMAYPIIARIIDRSITELLPIETVGKAPAKGPASPSVTPYNHATNCDDEFAPNNWSPNRRTKAASIIPIIPLIRRAIKSLYLIGIKVRLKERASVSLEDDNPG